MAGRRTKWMETTGTNRAEQKKKSVLNSRPFKTKMHCYFSIISPQTDRHTVARYMRIHAEAPDPLACGQQKRDTKQLMHSSVHTDCANSVSRQIIIKHTLFQWMNWMPSEWKRTNETRIFKNIKFVANICVDGKKYESFSGLPKWWKGANEKKKRNATNRWLFPCYFNCFITHKRNFIVLFRNRVAWIRKQKNKPEQMRNSKNATYSTNHFIVVVAKVWARTENCLPIA